MVEKIAVKSIVRTMVPGYKYARVLVPAPPAGRKLSPSPAPRTTHRMRGCATEPATRLGCRKKRRRSLPTRAATTRAMLGRAAGKVARRGAVKAGAVMLMSWDSPLAARGP